MNGFHITRNSHNKAPTINELVLASCDSGDTAHIIINGSGFQNTPDLCCHVGEHDNAVATYLSQASVTCEFSICLQEKDLVTLPLKVVFHTYTTLLIFILAGFQQWTRICV